jgi:excisionase family DNA binding protein
MNKPLETKTQDSPSVTSSSTLPSKQTFSVPELAEIMGVNHKTIRELITAGKIREIRLGRVIRIARSEVLKLLGE